MRRRPGASPLPLSALWIAIIAVGLLLSTAVRIAAADEPVNTSIIFRGGGGGMDMEDFFRAVMRSQRRAAPKASSAAGKPGDPRYRRDDIADARFGDPASKRQQLLDNARKFKQTMETRIVGQDAVAQAMQDRLIQYLHNWGTRTKDPIQLHMIGLPGIGKTALLDALEETGMRVVRLDAQQYGGDSASYDLRQKLEEIEEIQQEEPVVILVDEIDKLREIVQEGSQSREVNQLLIGGFLNPLLNDGEISLAGETGTIKLSNVMVVTAMNFDPVDIDTFSKQALGKKKSFYDFTTADFARFHTWVQRDKAAVPKILSRLFRAHTVSRLAPNTVIAKPLTEADYREIVRQKVKMTIERETTGENAGKRLKAEVSPRMVEFLFKKTLNPALGARDIVSRVDALVSQLMLFGQFGTHAGDTSLDQPRDLLFDYDPRARKAIVRVTPRPVNSKREVKSGTPFDFKVDFDASSRAFIQPANLATARPPRSSKGRTVRGGEPLIREVKQFRFPPSTRSLAGLADKIGTRVYGQEPMARLIERELTSYSARVTMPSKPSFTVLAGFPGIGKSEIVSAAGEYTGLPIARVNLQAFGADELSSRDSLARELHKAMQGAREKSTDGRYILLIEELDKLYEIHPMTGMPVPRPAMEVVKDLLDKGRSDNGSYKLDMRDAYTFVTMNFAVDRFGFEADPRLTTLDDVFRAWKRLATRAADRKRLLQSMFLPETVSRIFDKVHVMRPLSRDSHKKIIRAQVERVIAERMKDARGRDVGQVTLELSPAYEKYLFSEAVIPSEGGRQTAVASLRILSRDLEAALKGLPRSSKLAGRPITIRLHFHPRREHVIASFRAAGEPASRADKVILDREIALSFPPPRTTGKLDWERLFVGVHEFGHAYASVLLGSRIEYATVVGPYEGVGGYVKPRRSGMGAKDLMGELYMLMASRAMERIFQSPNPEAIHSVLDVTAGSSMDNKMATGMLYTLLYQVGLVPSVGPASKAVEVFEMLPQETQARLGLVLKDVEDHMVKTFLAAHPREWYRDKIVAFTKAGGVTEKQFYGLIDTPYPGDNANSFGEVSLLYDHFKDVIKPLPKEIQAAQKFRHGEVGTAAENVDGMVENFLGAISNHMHTSHVDKQQLARAMEALQGYKAESRGEVSQPRPPRAASGRRGTRGARSRTTRRGGDAATGGAAALRGLSPARGEAHAGGRTGQGAAGRARAPRARSGRTGAPRAHR